MNPFEAATAVLAANDSTFMSRTIRVDKLRLPSAIALETATSALAKRDAWLPSNTDPKRSLFVGGLDYAAKEEDVRVLFEELVKSERGPSAERYITGVRIIRDAATQLGKGFGYVHFKVGLRYQERLLALTDRTERVLKSSLPWTRRSSGSPNALFESKHARLCHYMVEQPQLKRPLKRREHPPKVPCPRAIRNSEMPSKTYQRKSERCTRAQTLIDKLGGWPRRRPRLDLSRIGIQVLSSLILEEARTSMSSPRPRRAKLGVHMLSAR
jgi:hypothetical protein